MSFSPQTPDLTSGKTLFPNKITLAGFGNQDVDIPCWGPPCSFQCIDYLSSLYLFGTCIYFFVFLYYKEHYVLHMDLEFGYRYIYIPSHDVICFVNSVAREGSCRVPMCDKLSGAL